MSRFAPLVTAEPLPQVRASRAPSGLIAWDTTRASDGFVLVAPSLGGDTVYLVDLAGQPAHTWRTPYPPGLDAHLTQAGTLFYTGKTPPEDPSHFIASQPWKGGWVGELDWDGTVLWSVEHPMAHHSAALLANGNVLLICLEALPPDIAAQVPGGRPGSEWRGTMFSDVLIELTKAGQEVRRWSLWEDLDPADNPLTAEQEDRTEWTHCNSVVELPSNDFLVSFRATSTVAVLDRETGKFTWSIGPPLLAQQHAPYVIDNGHILLFDNGTHRRDHYLPHSRVLEIDPGTKAIVWSYQDPLLVDFFSPLTANAQRLPGGNTLVTEATFGRIFEITHEGEVVWEFISPWFVVPTHAPLLPAMNRLFRAYKYSAEQVAIFSRGALSSAIPTSQKDLAMELVLLGTAGGPRPSPHRSAPAQAVVHDELVYVVDCGSGVVGQMLKAGLRPQDTAAIFITHLHADHMLDMGALPLTAWTDGLSHPVALFGPPPTASSFSSFLAMMSAELMARTATTGRAAFADLIEVTELSQPSVVLKRGDLTVRAVLVDHPPFEVALAYRFDGPSGSVVISGDTCYSPALVELAQDADILVHEAIYEPALELQLAGTGAATLREHLISSHTTAENAGRVAREAGVSTLVLSHLVPHHDGVTDGMWRSAAATEFAGRIVVGRDLMRFQV